MLCLSSASFNPTTSLSYCSPHSFSSLLHSLHPFATETATAKTVKTPLCKLDVRNPVANPKRPPIMRAYTSSFSAQALSLLTASLALWSTQAGPSLDVTNKDAVQTAAEASIKNLLAMYGNAEDGGFNQVDLPWWACTPALCKTRHRMGGVPD